MSLSMKNFLKKKETHQLKHKMLISFLEKFSANGNLSKWKSIRLKCFHISYFNLYFLNRRIEHSGISVFTVVSLFTDLEIFSLTFHRKVFLSTKLRKWNCTNNERICQFFLVNLGK